MSRASDATFAVTNVYAPADHHDSQHFLEDWFEVASHVDSNWLVAGDFNLTRNADENSNGTLHQNLAELFNDPIHALAVIEIPLLDRLFTWSNHRAKPTLARLDRVFFNNSMSLAFPNSSLCSLPKPTSDHTPLLLNISTTIPKSNVFRFENAWLKHRDFLPTVLPAWSDGLSQDAAGSLARSLKAVRCAAKVWARGKRAPPALIQNCKFVIYLFDVLEEERSLSAGERTLRLQCQDRLALTLRE